MTKTTVARRYAKALFNLVEAQAQENVKEGLLLLSKSVSDSVSLKHALASPVFTLEEKSTVLEALSEKMNFPPVLKDFFRQLVKKNRTGVLPEIAEAFKDIVDQRRGRLQVWVTSAREIVANEREDFTSSFSSLLHQEVDISFSTQSNLISGLQVRIGSKVFDSSVRSRLNTIKSLLAKG